MGGYNSFYFDVVYGDIYFLGGGVYNIIICKGFGNDFVKEGMINVKVDEIVLIKVVMSGLWIG